MSLQAGKETVYSEAFRRLLEVSREEGPMRPLRSEAFAVFTEKGFPTVKSEDWKYTNVAPIAKVDWAISSPVIKKLNDDVAPLVRSFDFERNGLTALNLAF